MCPGAGPERRPGPTFWVLLFGIPTLFFALMYLVDGQRMVSERWRMTEAEGVIADVDRPPGPDADWDRVPIPRNYNGTPGGSSLWWRFDLPDALKTPGLEWMLVVPSPRFSNLALWIDQRPLATHGDLHSKRSTPRNPVSFSVINPLAASPPEVVFLRTVSPLDSIAMSSVIIGPKTELSGYADYLDWAQRFSIQAIIAAMALLATIMTSVWLLRRGRDTVYGWYSLLLFLWAVHLMHSQIEYPPLISVRLWFNISLITLGWFVIAAFVFVNRLTDQHHPKLERGLMVFGLVGTLLILAPGLLGSYSLFFQTRIWVPGLLGVGLIILINLLSSLRQQPTAENKSLLILTCFLILVGLRDYAYNNLTIIDGNVLYLPFAAGFALIVFSVSLIRRFAAALDTAEQLNDELETRVEEKTRELDRQYARNLALENEQVLFGERQRLLQEMHDGLGGHIVHALAIAERDVQLKPMVSPLKLALEDLRLIIDSLDPGESAFGAVFSSLRARFSHTASALGMRFTWQFDPAFDHLELNPHDVLTLGRIVQEAVTNVVKHSGATELTILAAYEPVAGRATLSVSDNGSGFSTGGAVAGRGLTTMKSRATELKGVLKLVPLNPGTRVECIWYPRQKT